MYTTKLSYPTFKIDDTADARTNILPRAISEISPLYFDTNLRFNGLGKTSSPKLVDYMSIYKEGDSWKLTIVSVLGIDGHPQYLFMPLVADIKSKMVTKISEFVPINFGDVAFGLETHSQIKEIRNWKVVDAFSDIGFILKLIDLFLPWERLDPDHPNAYTEISNSGIGKFIFHSTANFQKGWEHTFGTEVLPALTESGDVLLNYSGSYQLTINSILSTVTNVDLLKSTPNVAGWIAYSGPQTPELLIGVLKELRS